MIWQYIASLKVRCLLMFEMCLSIAVVLALIFHLTCGNNIHYNIVIDIPSVGKIGGRTSQLPDGTPLVYFLGIPFATPPTEQFRFEEPLPLAEPLPGIWEATYNVPCLQYKIHNREIFGTEDCLYLNIYTTTLEKTANHNVLVYFHGGEFSSGYSELQTPEYLFSFTKNLVFVSINYRLGPFGFLSTEDGVVPGNNGLKDQVVALQWVQENIKIFGGSPKKVTIAGMGAGAVSVHLHYLSPLSKDLFTRGISISGAALSPMVKTTSIREEAEHLASLVNCQTTNSFEMVKCLKEVDGKQLLHQLANARLPWEEYSPYYVHFGPVIEKEGSNPFLDTHPFFLLKRGEVKNSPWLVSTLPAEGYVSKHSFIKDSAMLERLNNEWNDIAPFMLLFSGLGSDDKLLQTSQKVKSEYLKDNSVTQADHTELAKLIGERVFVTNIENAARLHAAASKAPVYLYTFDYVGEYSFAKTSAETNVHVFDDLIYILTAVEFKIEVQQDIDMVGTMVFIWLSFIESGVPGKRIGIKWPELPRNSIKTGDLNYVKIVGPKDIIIASSPGISKREFWDKLPLDELHVVGDQKIPSHIQALQKRRGGIVSRYIVNSITSILFAVLDSLRFIIVTPIYSLLHSSLILA